MKARRRRALVCIDIGRLCKSAIGVNVSESYRAEDTYIGIVDDGATRGLALRRNLAWIKGTGRRLA